MDFSGIPNSVTPKGLENFILGLLQEISVNLDKSCIVARISNNIKTLIDNIFCNIPNPLVKSAMSGNISSSISDHLPQFFILPECFSKSPPTKYNISHDWEKFNNQSFLQGFEKINWNQVLQLNQNNINITFENYLNTVNTLINSSLEAVESHP